MREIALVVGAVLITFFGKNTSDIDLTEKNEFLLIRGHPSRFFTIFDDVLLIQRAVGPGPKRHTTMREN